MSFFTQDFIDFFSELSENNNREWFQSNKKRYENSVKKPFESFIDEIIGRFHMVDSDIAILPKDAIFRIYRDVRFSKDKKPYKDHCSALISKMGRKDHTSPGMYIQANHLDFRMYGGTHMLEKDNLYKVRSFIAAHADEFKNLLNDKKFKETYSEILGDKNKIIPKEFKEDAEIQPLIYNKSFYFFAKLPPQEILNEDLADVVMEHYHIAKPLSDFFKEALTS